MKSVSIIIPNWNGADLLRAHLPSVVDAEKKYRGTIEVIVVDDASSDASLEILQEEFPGIKTVVHPDNLGFGRACWSGVQAAQHSILIFLNSDVAVAPDFVEPLVNNLKTRLLLPHHRSFLMIKTTLAMRPSVFLTFGGARFDTKGSRPAIFCTRAHPCPIHGIRYSQAGPHLRLIVPGF